MKKKFTEAQIVFALRQAESGTPIAEIIRKAEGQYFTVGSTREEVPINSGASDVQAGNGLVLWGLSDAI
jgi:hypothetical protein